MSIFYFEYKSNVKSNVVLIDYVSLIDKLKKYCIEQYCFLLDNFLV